MNRCPGETVEELQASRARVVAAGDAERRRIERELHDGVQQHLVALVVNLQLARQLVESDPAAAARLLEELGRDAREALEGVRGLAYEIYPPLLLDRGLADALHTAAAQVEAPCRVEAEGLDRYAPEVEAAAYFCCVEALRNAGAPATLSAREADGALVFEVVSGGETDAADAQGLVAAADRIAALGGRLTVSSEPGRGARISGSIPVEP